MKKLLLTICILLALTSTVGARMTSMVAGGGVPVAVCDDTTGMIVAEDAETNDDPPSGWTDNGSTTNWNYGTALRGAQSLLLAGTAYSAYSFAAQTEVWGHFLFQVEAITTDDVIFYGGAGTDYYVRFTGTDGTLRQACGGDGANSAAGTITAGNTYHIWYHVTAGAGTGSCELWVGTSTTRPASAAISQTSKTINNINQIQPNSSTADDHIFDQIRVDNAEFTTVCE